MRLCGPRVRHKVQHMGQESGKVALQPLTTKRCNKNNISLEGRWKRITDEVFGRQHRLWLLLWEVASPVWRPPAPPCWQSRHPSASPHHFSGSQSHPSESQWPLALEPPPAWPASHSDASLSTEHRDHYLRKWWAHTKLGNKDDDLCPEYACQNNSPAACLGISAVAMTVPSSLATATRTP